MKKIWNSILNMIYPRCCPLCHKVLKDQSRLICPECEATVKPISGPCCFKCGRPVGRDEEYCRECATHPRSFTQGRGIFLYNDKMKASLIKYKYYGCREYGDFYAKAMCVFARHELTRWNPQLIIPVPLHRKKQRMRGFNQAAYLAQRISGYTGIPVDLNLIIKTKNTKSQKKLNAAERRRNLKEAFQVQGQVRCKRILVIDDVYTTGSTVDAMAECLLEAGAEKVYFLTVCIGV